MLYDFTKNHKGDKIWWTSEVGVIGCPIFSFDKKTLFYLWRDYPYKLTKEQKAVFDKENPYWANAFKDREFKPEGQEG